MTTRIFLRCVLLGGAAIAVATGQVDPPTTQTNPTGTATLYGCVYSGNVPQPGEPVWFSVIVNQGSGGHNHVDSTRPNGTVSPTYGVTDGTGCVRTTFAAPDVAGTYVVTGTTNVGESSAYVNVLLSSPQYMQWLPPYYTYQIVGIQPEHPSSPYGTFHAVYSVQQIAVTFQQQTGLLLGVNDMSLPWGGRLDLGPRYGGTWWHAPHEEHMWGLNADLPYQYMGNQRNLLYQIAVNNGGAAGGPIVQHPDHYHLRFAY